MSRNVLTITVVVISVLTASAIGCGDPFEPKWRIDDYRLIAIQAEPPVVESGESTTLQVVDYRPDDREVTYTWEWCPFETSAQNRYKCPEIDFDELGSGGQQAMNAIRTATSPLSADADAGTPLDTGPSNTDGNSSDAAHDTGLSDAGDATADAGTQIPFPPPGPDPYKLGTGRQIDFPYPGTEQQVLEICRAIQRAVARAGENSPISGLLPTANCTRGYEVSIRVVADTGDEEIVARKKLELSTGSDQINKNPRVAGVEIRPSKGSDVKKLREKLDWVVSRDRPRSEQWVEMPADRSLPLVAGVPFDLRATVDREDIEMWRPPAPEGSSREELPPRLEIWTFNWLTTLGDLEDASRIYDPDLNTLDKASRSGLNIPSDDLDGCASSGSCSGRIWTIVRDGRLGLDWAERTYEISVASQ